MKKRRSKRILSIILVLTLLFTMLMPEKPGVLVLAANLGGGPSTVVTPSVVSPGGISIQIPPVTDLQSPVLSEDITDNVIGNSVEITYADNEDWRNKIKNITVDGATVTSGSAITGMEMVTISPGKIVLDQNLFTLDETSSAKVFTITVNAEGYTNAVAKQTITKTKSDWNLIWNDDFSGDTLDTSKWSFQTGIKANPDGPIYWGNNEKEFYTEENTSVKDGKLVIEAKNDGREGMPYTSSRIRTVTDDKRKLFTTRYGKIEAKMKLPKGQGFWPAFWMLPADETYGIWAASGEIDIMEARGQEPNSIDGTIHYGSQWPNNTYSGGRYTFGNGTDINDFHIYSIEWEPGEMRWYVDGELFSTKNRWYSKGAKEADNYTYPAPFDEEFYLLLNLAVGGNYVSNVEPTPEDFNTPATMEVDYVRVYQKDSYNEDVTEPEAEKDTDKFATYSRDTDGSFVTDRNFDTVNMTAIKDGKLEDTSSGQTGEARFPLGRWFFATQSDFGASATLSKEVISEKTFTKVSIANGGNQTYSTQLIQYVSLAKGYTYEIAFDAKSDAPRTIIAKAAGNADAGFPSYSPSFESALTTQLQHYSYKFTMTESSQDRARLELNLGIDMNAVTIGNITVKETEPDMIGNDGTKTPLEDGNHIYNGTFDQGTNRMKFWHVDGASPITLNRQMKVIINKTTGTIDEVKLYQKGIQLLQKDNYQLTFDAGASKVRNITVRFVGKDGVTVYGEKIYELSTEISSFTGERAYTFTMPEGVTDEEAQLVFCLGGDDSDITIDNVKLLRTTNQNIDYTGVNLYPILNGDFTIGTTGWTAYQTNLIIENGILKAPGGNGVNVYDNMVMHENMLLSKDMTYVLSFKAKASASKLIKFTIEDASYTPILQEDNYAVGSEWVTYTKIFTVNTSKKYSLKFQIGAIGAFDFCLDDVELKVKDAPLAKPAMIVSYKKNIKVGENVILKYYGTPEWENSNKKVYVDGSMVSDEFVEYKNGKITLNSSVFIKSAAYEIYVKADGYSDTNTITQTLIPRDGNLLLNGDFSEKLEPWQGWFKYNGDAGRNVGSVSIDNKMAKVFHEWNEGQNWDLQFYQENIALEGGKTYIFSFDAKASVERPIDIEIGVGVALGKVNLGTEMKNYKLTYQPSVDMVAKINFLMGNVTNGDLTTPGNNTESHYLYFDNIKLIEEGASTDPSDPTTPSNPSSSTQSQQSNSKTISNAKVTFVIDNKLGVINANVVTGIKTTFINDRLDIIASIPLEEILNTLGKNLSMNISMNLDSDSIVNEITKEEVEVVNISVVIPSALSENKNINISNLILENKVLQEAGKYKKDIVVFIKDETGVVQYSWTFDPIDAQNNKDQLSNINLLLDYNSVMEDQDIVNLLKKGNNQDTSFEGMVINFKHSGIILPSTSIANIHINEQYGILKDKENYIYHYNEKIKKLEELPVKMFKVSGNLTITLPIIQGDRYVVLPMKAGNNITSSLITQVKVNLEKRTLKVGKSTNLKVLLPITIKTVKTFSKQTEMLAITEAKITYKSSKPTIATISTSGKITAKKAGKTAIYVTVLLKDGTKKIYKKVITVK